MVRGCRHPICSQAKVGSSCHPYDIENLAGDLVGINILNKVVEGSLQRSMPDSLLNFASWSRGDHRTLAEYKQMGADSLNHFQNVRAIEHRLPSLPQGPNQVLENKRRRNVKPRKRFIE